jgi:hypothetical protein
VSAFLGVIPAAADQECGDRKILAKAPTALGKDREQLVIRSAKELTKVSPDNRVQMMMKVPRFDWDKQMLISVSGGTQRTGGYSVEITSLKVEGGKLKVGWKLNAPAPGGIVTQVITHPGVTVLVDRFDGPVVFDPPAAKGDKGEGK